MRAGRPDLLARAWRPDEDAVVREHYAERGAAAVAAMLPGRTQVAVQVRANRFGIKYVPRWTRADDLVLEDMWDSGARIGWIARRLSRSRRAVRARATQLQLGTYAPHGFETLQAAVRRVGYNTVGQLRRVLAWARVRLHVSRAHAPKRKWRCHFVDPDQVDQAVKAWMRTETLAEAMRRHQVDRKQLLRLLARIGVAKGRSKTVFWRLDPADVDRAMTNRRR